MKTSPPTDDKKSGWFERPETVRKLWFGLLAACAFFVILDLVLVVVGFDKHPYFQWQQWPALYAVTGFVACVVLSLGAGYGLRPLVRRREDFYESGDPEGDSRNHLQPDHDANRSDTDA